MGELELVVDAKAVLGEGPSWDAKQKQWYWVDIMSKRIHRDDPQTGKNETIELDQPVGAVVPTREGDLIAAMQNGFYRISEDGSQITPLGDPEEDKPDNRFNDGKCDVTGRFWAGTMAMKGGGPVGALYTLEKDGTIVKKLDGVTISNGLAWSPDNKTMYYIDSPTRRIDAFDFDKDSGQIVNRRTVISFPGEEGVPDGMTIDAEGMLWVAHWGGWKVWRFDPNSGRVLDEIPVPAAHVTSCCFGGEDGNELYITTARIGLSDEELEKQPHAGGLFRIRTNVKGAPTYEYGG